MESKYLKLHAVNVHGMRHFHIHHAHGHAALAAFEVGEFPDFQVPKLHDLIPRNRIHLEHAAIDGVNHALHRQRKRAGVIAVDSILHAMTHNRRETCWERENLRAFVAHFQTHYVEWRTVGQAGTAHHTASHHPSATA